MDFNPQIYMLYHIVYVKQFYFRRFDHKWPLGFSHAIGHFWLQYHIVLCQWRRSSHLFMQILYSAPTFSHAFNPASPPTSLPLPYPSFAHTTFLNSKEAEFSNSFFFLHCTELYLLLQTTWHHNSTLQWFSTLLH